MRLAFSRIRAFFRSRDLDRDFDQELESHLSMLAEDHERRGLTVEEARRAARVQLGGAAQLREAHRAVRGLPLLEALLQDVRYAIRGFRRAPIFVLTIVATIGLGLGLDTALFTIFDATYLRPIGVRDPRALYEIYWTDRTGNAHDFSWREHQGLPAGNPAFSESFGYREAQARLDGHDVLGTLVTGEYFQVLGVGAALGRTLLPEDTSAPGREPVVVLSFQAWQKRFGGEPGIVGKKLLLRGYPFDVVGVAPAGFTGLGSRPAEFWAPVTMGARLEDPPDLFGPENPRSLSIVGRLRAGFSERQAQAGLTVWTRQLTANAPDSEKSMQGHLLSRASTKPLSVSTALGFTPILAAFSLVLLIGCANVANMMLARSLSRQREIGIRLSLGASRGRLIRQLLTECVLLALPSAAAGIAVSEATIRVCLRVLLATLPPGVAGIAARIPDLHSDFRVFAFALAGALAAAFVFGLTPAIQATRADVMQAAKGDFADQFRPSRLRNLLVIGQVTTCVLLLVTAGTLLRGVDRIHSLDATLSSRNTIQIVVQEKSREAVLSRLSSDPAIETMAGGSSAPVERKTMIGVQSADGGASSNIAANNVSPEYFGLFDIPIVRGRNFTAGEARSGAAVAVISQAAAQRLWPGREAVGQSMKLTPAAARAETVSVIGVARDEISRWIGNGEDSSLVYRPGSLHAAGNEIFLSSRGDVEAARRSIEAELAAVDPAAVQQIQKLQIREWVAEDAYYTFRILYWLSSGIGFLALLLTLSGIYGVISYVISQRTKEIGIRMAMGATTRAVTALILKQSMKLAVAGAAVGCVLAMGLSRIAASALLMIDAWGGAAAYVGGVMLVLAACAAAAYFPSRRAARIDPLTTLRYD